MKEMLKVEVIWTIVAWANSKVVSKMSFILRQEASLRHEGDFNLCSHRRDRLKHDLKCGVVPQPKQLKFTVLICPHKDYWLIYYLIVILKTESQSSLFNWSPFVSNKTFYIFHILKLSRQATKLLLFGKKMYTCLSDRCNCTSFNGT